MTTVCYHAQMASNSHKHEFGQRFREARKAVQMTQERLAKQLGLVKQSISFWETGRWMPEPHLLARAAQRLEVSTDWLLLGIDPTLNGARNVPLPYPTLLQLAEIANGTLNLAAVERRWPS